MSCLNLHGGAECCRKLNGGTSTTQGIRAVHATTDFTFKLISKGGGLRSYRKNRWRVGHWSIGWRASWSKSRRKARRFAGQMRKETQPEHSPCRSWTPQTQIWLRGMNSPLPIPPHSIASTPKRWVPIWGPHEKYRHDRLLPISSSSPQYLNPATTHTIWHPKSLEYNSSLVIILIPLASLLGTWVIRMTKPSRSTTTQPRTF